jgi:type IV pilus assembly protein PilE
MDTITMNPQNLSARHGMGRHEGFTLVELVVTMLVVALLAAIAIPSYSKYVIKSHRTEAKTALLDIASLEERYFSTSNGYTLLPSDLGYSGAAGFAFPVGNNYYNVLVSTTTATAPTSANPGGTPATYLLTATAIGTQGAKDTACPTFTLDSKGVQGPTGTTCWQ